MQLVYNVGDVITGSNSGAKSTLMPGTVTHGTGAVFLGYSQEDLGAVKGVEIRKFGTGYAIPDLVLPVKILLSTKYNGANPHANAGTLSSSTAFAVSIVTGGLSSASGVVTAWDETTQILTVRVTSHLFLLEKPTRGALLTMQL